MTESLKLLLICLNSKATVNIVNITNCCCNVPNYRNLQLKEMAESYPRVTVLKVDYVILGGGIFDAISDGKLVHLKMLTVFVKEHDHLQHELKDDDWHSVVVSHPALKVAFCFCKQHCFTTLAFFYYHYRFSDNNCSAHLRFFLKSNIPLTSISLCCNGKSGFYEENRTSDIESSLSLILRNYNNILG